MNITTEDDKKSMSKYYKAKDAERYTAENIGSYSSAEIALMNEIATLAAETFNASVYKNVRKNFLVVKVEKPTVMQKRSDDAAALLEYCMPKGIVVTEENGHVYYRIPHIGR